MTEVKIAVIVEGHGECEAVPILIRRIAETIDPGFVPKILQPLRVPALKLLKEGEIERSVDFAARKLKGEGGIIIIIDCDWENGCPAREGPLLLKRATAARRDLPITVILAKKEFEAWFLTAAESLQNQFGFPNDLEPPTNPENIRDAKKWLTERMPPGRSYSAVIDQPKFTSLFDMSIARRSDSFDKCYREVRDMLIQLRQSEPAKYGSQ